MTESSPSKPFLGAARPDAILVALPVAFLGAYGFGRWAVESQSLALGFASLVCVVILADGLVVNPPVRDGTR